MTDRAAYRIQYADMNEHVQTGVFTLDDLPDKDTTSATVWSGAHGDSLILSMTRRKRRDGWWWYIGSSDGFIDITWYRRRFHTVESALSFLGRRWNQEFVVATCRCGTSEECD